MDVAVLLSGGKDSVFSLYQAIKAGHIVKYLVTIFTENKESWMFHHPCSEITKLQAEALRIKHITANSRGEKETELEDLKKVLIKMKDEVEAIVSGAIKSTYQKSRIDSICREIGLESITPIWQRSELDVLKEEISLMEIMIVGTYSDGFDKSWLGRKIDEKCLNELVDLAKRYKINLAGEGGEYETIVLDCPIFKKKIKIEEMHAVWEGDRGYIVIDRAKLVGK